MGEKPPMDVILTTHSICGSCFENVWKSAFPSVISSPEAKEKFRKLILGRLKMDNSK